MGFGYACSMSSRTFSGVSGTISNSSPSIDTEMSRNRCIKINLIRTGKRLIELFCNDKQTKTLMATKTQENFWRWKENCSGISRPFRSFLVFYIHTKPKDTRSPKINQIDAIATLIRFARWKCFYCRATWWGRARREARREVKEWRKYWKIIAGSGKLKVRVKSFFI